MESVHKKCTDAFWTLVCTLHKSACNLYSTHLNTAHKSEQVLCTAHWKSALYMECIGQIELYCTLFTLNPRVRRRIVHKRGHTSQELHCTRKWTCTMHTTLTECTLYGVHWPQNILYCPRANTRIVHKRGHTSQELGHCTRKWTCCTHTITERVLFIWNALKTVNKMHCTMHLEPKSAHTLHKKGHTSQELIQSTWTLHKKLEHLLPVHMSLTAIWNALNKMHCSALYAPRTQECTHVLYTRMGTLHKNLHNKHEHVLCTHHWQLYGMHWTPWQSKHILCTDSLHTMECIEQNVYTMHFESRLYTYFAQERAHFAWAPGHCTRKGEHVCTHWQLLYCILCTLNPRINMCCPLNRMYCTLCILNPRLYTYCTQERAKTSQLHLDTAQ